MQSTERLFISYSTKDSGVVNEIVARLRSLGLDVWLDQSQISASDNIVGQIDDGLSRWKYFLMFASKSYFASPWATSEYRAAFYAALGANERKIIVIRLDDVELPPLVAGNRHIRLTTSSMVAEEIARTVAQTDRTQTLAEDYSKAGRPSPTPEVMKWDSVQDRVLFAILSELFKRRGELLATPDDGQTVKLHIAIAADLLVTLEIARPLLGDRILLPEMESDWQSYQIVARIAATLRRRLLQGGLAIFEGAFEVELETKEAQLADIKKNLREQLAALSPRLFVASSDAQKGGA